VRDSTLVAWYPSLYAPRTGGAYDSHHRTAGIAGRTRRGGGRVAARCARAAVVAGGRGSCGPCAPASGARLSSSPASSRTASLKYNGVPATRTSRGAPRGDEERGVVFAATREPKYPFIRCSSFGRSNPREQALWTPSIATS